MLRFRCTTFPYLLKCIQGIYPVSIASLSATRGTCGIISSFTSSSVPSRRPHICLESFPTSLHCPNRPYHSDRIHSELDQYRNKCKNCFHFLTIPPSSSKPNAYLAGSFRTGPSCEKYVLGRVRVELGPRVYSLLIAHDAANFLWAFRHFSLR